MTEYTIGIDILKTHLDAFRLEDQEERQFEDTPKGIRVLIRWLGQTSVARIVFEPTGPYHRSLETAPAGQFPLVKVNPLQARRFAEACGTRAKTDAVDARILARMGFTLNLVPDVPIIGESAFSQRLADGTHSAGQGTHAPAKPQPCSGQPISGAPDQSTPGAGRAADC